jgi:hypothetical protein
MRHGSARSLTTQANADLRLWQGTLGRGRNVLGSPLRVCKHVALVSADFQVKHELPQHEKSGRLRVS